MRQVNIQEAKDRLFELAEEVGAGETIIISRAGKPPIKLVPLEGEPSQSEEDKPREKKPRELGFLKGKLVVPDDFDTMFQDEIIAMFEGRE